MPELSVLRYAPYLMTKGFLGLRLHIDRDLVVGRTVFNDNATFGVEVFIPLFVGPEMVQQITEVSKPPPKYKFRDRK